MGQNTNHRSQSFWENLAQAEWKRKKWRSDTDGKLTVCCVYGHPIHHEATYYLRPAYTDGNRWMSQQAYKEMCRKVGKPVSNQYHSENKKAD